MESETDNGSITSEMSSGADRNTDEFDDRDRAADYDDCQIKIEDLFLLGQASTPDRAS